jgi:putative DNA primase/helicase
VGSVAFGAVARVVMVAARVKSEDGETKRILARSKSNIGADDGGFEYVIEQTELDAWPGIFASHIGWGQAVEGTARELLAEVEAEGGESVEMADVGGFLRGLLADGPVPVKAIKADADGAGYSWDQVKRASLRIGVEKRKLGMSGGWTWASKIAEGSEGSEGSKSQRVALFDAALDAGVPKGAEGSEQEMLLPSHSSRSSALPSAASSAGNSNAEAI